MTMNIFEYLEHVGVSHKEIDVYIYLLSVDSALPMEISKDIKIKRSTVYVILDLLKGKGLVREIQRGKRAAYVAEDPERIRYLLEDFKLQTEKNIRSFEIILPELKATLRRPNQPPVIKFYEGEAGVQTSMEEFGRKSAFSY